MNTTGGVVTDRALVTYDRQTVAGQPLILAQGSGDL